MHDRSSRSHGRRLFSLDDPVLPVHQASDQTRSPLCLRARHLVNIVHDLTERGIGLKVLTGQGSAIDTTTASGKLVFGIFAALAEFSVIWTRRDARLPDLGVAA